MRAFGDDVRRVRGFWRFRVYSALGGFRLGLGFGGFRGLRGLRVCDVRSSGGLGFRVQGSGLGGLGL